MLEVAVGDADHAATRTDSGTGRTGLVVDEAALVDVQLVTGEEYGTTEHILDLTSVDEIDPADIYFGVIGGTEYTRSLPALIARLLSAFQCGIVALYGADFVLVEVQLPGEHESSVFLEVDYGLLIVLDAEDGHLGCRERLGLCSGIFVAAIGSDPVFDSGKRLRSADYGSSSESE